MNLFIPRRETWLFHVNPALKLVICIALLCIALVNRHFEFALYQAIAYLLLFILLSGHGWKRIALFCIPLLLTSASSMISMTLFGKGEDIWWSWGLIKITSESFRHGLLLSFKTLSFGALGLLFALTSKPLMLFYALMQQFRFPAKYAYSLIAAIRLLPVIWEEVGTRSNALEIRGIHFEKSIKGTYKKLSAYVIPLLAQSIRRAQRIAVAMEAKRFHIGAKRTYYYHTSYTRIDALFITVMLCSVLLTYYLA